MIWYQSERWNTPPNDQVDAAAGSSLLPNTSKSSSLDWLADNIFLEFAGFQSPFKHQIHLLVRSSFPVKTEFSILLQNQRRNTELTILVL